MGASVKRLVWFPRGRGSEEKICKGRGKGELEEELEGNIFYFPPSGGLHS